MLHISIVQGEFENKINSNDTCLPLVKSELLHPHIQNGCFYIKPRFKKKSRFKILRRFTTHLFVKVLSRSNTTRNTHFTLGNLSANSSRRYWQWTLSKKVC